MSTSPRVRYDRRRHRAVLEDERAKGQETMRVRVVWSCGSLSDRLGRHAAATLCSLGNIYPRHLGVARRRGGEDSGCNRVSSQPPRRAPRDAPPGRVLGRRTNSTNSSEGPVSEAHLGCTDEKLTPGGQHYKLRDICGERCRQCTRRTVCDGHAREQGPMPGTPSTEICMVWRQVPRRSCW
jgi:hypothetical protein